MRRGKPWTCLKATERDPRTATEIRSMVGSVDRACKPLIVPVFIPHGGCPHRCAFCNQSLITGASSADVHPSNIHHRIQSFLDGCRTSRRPSQIAFFGGNFLGLSPDRIVSFLSVAGRFVTEKKIDGIRFSTRPDTIDSERLALLSGFPVETVEIGAQSMMDPVLEMAGRGHGAADTVRAAGLVREKGFELGLQIMVGLPGDDEEACMETARRAAELSPDFVRIYPTVVVAGSRLADWYRDGTYHPWSLERAVSLVSRLLVFFQRKKIKVIRMGLQATEDLQAGDTILAGPYHPAFGHLVYSHIFMEQAMGLLMCRMGEKDGKCLPEVVLRVHPRAESRLRGLKNENIRRLKERFGIERLAVQGDESLAEDDIELI